MSTSDYRHHSAGKAPAEFSDAPLHPPSPYGGVTGCHHEARVVKDGTAARMALVFLMEFVENRPMHNNTVEEFRCPMLRCMENFTEPLLFIQHLLKCPCLGTGEFECCECNTYHVFPTAEREWAEFVGWKPCRLRPKPSFGQKMKEHLKSKLVTRDRERLGGRQSRNSFSSSSSTASPSSTSPMLSFSNYYHHKRTSEDSCSNLAGETPQYQAPNTSPVEYQPERGRRHHHFEPDFEAGPAELLPEYAELGSQPICPELESSCPSSADEKLRDFEHHYQQAQQYSAAQQRSSSRSVQQQQQHPQQQFQPQGIATPVWSSYDSVVSNHSAAAPSKPIISSSHGAIPTQAYLVSPQSSVDGGSYSQAQIPRQPTLGLSPPPAAPQTPQFVDGNFSESPVELDNLQAGRPPWAAAATCSHATSSTAPHWDSLSVLHTQTQSDTQLPSHTQTTFSNATAQEVIGSWSPGDDAEVMSRYRGFASHQADNSQRAPTTTTTEANDFADSSEFDGLGDFDPLLKHADNDEDDSMLLFLPGGEVDEEDGDGDGDDEDLDDAPPIIHASSSASSSAPLLTKDQAANRFTCSTCGWKPSGIQKGFAGYLRKHKLTHLNIKEPCRFLGCERTFTRKDNRQKHEKMKHYVGMLQQQQAPAELEGSSLASLMMMELEGSPTAASASSMPPVMRPRAVSRRGAVRRIGVGNVDAEQGGGGILRPLREGGNQVLISR